MNSRLGKNTSIPLKIALAWLVDNVLCCSVTVSDAYLFLVFRVDHTF